MATNIFFFSLVFLIYGNIMKTDNDNLIPRKQYQLYISNNIYINISNAYTLRHLLYTSEKQEEERLCNYHTNSTVTIPFVYQFESVDLYVHINSVFTMLSNSIKEKRRKKNLTRQ